MKSYFIPKGKHYPKNIFIPCIKLGVRNLRFSFEVPDLKPLPDSGWSKIYGWLTNYGSKRKGVRLGIRGNGDNTCELCLYRTIDGKWNDDIRLGIFKFPLIGNCNMQDEGIVVLNITSEDKPILITVDSKVYMPWIIRTSGPYIGSSKHAAQEDTIIKLKK